MASSLKANIQDGKVNTIVEQFALKLPARNSHQYHATEGEVSLKHFNDILCNNFVIICTVYSSRNEFVCI